MADAVLQPSIDTAPQAARLGGWLILPALGLVLSPFRIALDMAAFFPLLKPAVWSALLDPASVSYRPSLAVFMAGEFLTNIAFFCLTIWLLICFFRKQRQTPSLYITWILANCIIQGADLAIATSFVDGSHAAGNGRDLFRALAGAVIWIPYFLLSERVKKTFVNAP